MVLTKGSYTGAWWFEFYNGGGLTFWFTDSGGSSHGVSFGTQALGHLHHYVGTYDGTAMIAYEDGKKVAATSTLATMATTSNPIAIGYGGFTQNSCHGVY